MLQEIEKFKLRNTGGFVTRIQFEYYDENSNEWKQQKGTGDITLGFDKTAEPGDYGVPEGSMVKLYAYVAWGTDNRASQMFIYKKNCGHIASYEISGTTLNNHLEYVGILNPASKNMFADVDMLASAQSFLQELSMEEWTALANSLTDGSRSYNGSCGPLSWNISFNLDMSDISKSYADVKVSLFSFNVINGRIDAKNPKAALDLTVAGGGVKGELGIDFAKRIVYLNGTLSYFFGQKDFNYTLVSF